MKNFTLKLTLVLCCFGSFSGVAFAQNDAAKDANPSAPGAAQRAAMKKLVFLVGTWQGSGWIMFGAGKRETFTNTETVQMKLGGAAVLIEGLGKNEKGETAHNALGLLTFDAKKGVYNFRAHLANGDSLDITPEITDKSFIWGFRNEAAKGDIRYTITLNEKGNWLEIGEFSPDGGKQWFKIFEMELKKVG
jgi:hypothetical protein